MSVKLILGSLRSEVLTNHTILVQQVLIALLDHVQIFLKLVDILVFSLFHLLEDLFLHGKLTVQVLSSRNGLVDRVLELQVLLLEDLNLTIGRSKPYLTVFQPALCVFEQGAVREELRVGIHVLFLLVLIALDPRLSDAVLVPVHLLQV